MYYITLFYDIDFCLSRQFADDPNAVLVMSCHVVGPPSSLRSFVRFSLRAKEPLGVPLPVFCAVYAFCTLSLGLDDVFSDYVIEETNRQNYGDLNVQEHGEAE